MSEVISRNPSRDFHSFAITNRGKYDRIVSLAAEARDRQNLSVNRRPQTNSLAGRRVLDLVASVGDEGYRRCVGRRERNLIAPYIDGYLFRSNKFVLKIFALLIAQTGVGDYIVYILAAGSIEVVCA